MTRLLPDPWMPTIIHLIHGKSEITTTAIFGHLAIFPKDQTPEMMHRIHRCFMVLDWDWEENRFGSVTYSKRSYKPAK